MRPLLADARWRHRIGFAPDAVLSVRAFLFLQAVVISNNARDGIGTLVRVAGVT